MNEMNANEHTKKLIKQKLNEQHIALHCTEQLVWKMKSDGGVSDLCTRVLSRPTLLLHSFACAEQSYQRHNQRF